jgi:hypothetical protein
MNERIKELAEQAGMTNDKFGMFFAKDKHDEDGVDLEKFAELLLKDCAASLDAYLNICNSNRMIGWQGKNILKHYGVKE